LHRLRVALAVDAQRVCAWHVEVAAALMSAPEIELAIVRTVGQDRARESWAGRIRERFRARAARRSRAFQIVDPPRSFVELPATDAVPSRAVGAPTAHHVDLLVSLSESPWSEPINRLGDRGSWVIRVAGHRNPRRGLFRPLARIAGDRRLVVGVHRADSRGRPASMVVEACVRSTGSARAQSVDEALLEVLPAMLTRACVAEACDTSKRGAVLTHDARVHGARHALALAAARLGGLLASPYWNVGVVDAPIERFLDPTFSPRVRWLPRPARGQFVADPFGLPADERGWLVESYDYATRRGVIAAVEVTGEKRPGPAVLDVETHASYPYLLTHGHDVYCVPQIDGETGIRIFRAVRYPTKWEDAGVLVPDVSARDSTVFEHDGLWWVAFTDGEGGAYTHLHLWWADALFGEWHPHALNPVKIDLRSARPAGTPFHHDGWLYRPAQDCSTSYGAAVAICKVHSLTPTSFREQVVRIVLPVQGRYRYGIHTLAAIGDRVLVDGKSFAFTTQGATTALRARFPRAARALTSRPRH
jgi:hypothetical protein